LKKQKSKRAEATSAGKKANRLTQAGGGRKRGKTIGQVFQKGEKKSVNNAPKKRKVHPIPSIGALPKIGGCGEGGKRLEEEEGGRISVWQKP